MSTEQIGKAETLEIRLLGTGRESAARIKALRLSKMDCKELCAVTEEQLTAYLDFLNKQVEIAEETRKREADRRWNARHL